MARTPVYGIGDDWRRLDPRTRVLIKVLALGAAPAFLLFMLDVTGTLSKLWLLAYGTYWLFKLLGWAIREDRKENATRSFEASFLDDLKEIDQQVRESMPAAAKPRVDKPQFRSADGEWMRCIMGCGRYTNKGGRFCDDCED